MKKRRISAWPVASFVTACDLFAILVACPTFGHQETKDMLASTQVVADKVPGLTEKLHSTELALGLSLEESEEKEGIINGLEEESAGNRKRLEELGKQVVQLNGQLKETLDKLRPGPPCRIVFVLDLTASMDSVVAELRTVLSTVFETLPNTSSKFECAVVAFRDGVVSELPLVEVRPGYEDNFLSQKELLDYVGSLNTENGFTDHLPAFEDACRMLMQPCSDETRCRLVVLSDVFSCELDSQPGYDAEERSRGKRLVEGVRKWAAMRPNNACISLYANTEWSEKDSYAAESRAFFEELGAVSSQSAFYDETSSLLRAVLQASLQ